MLRTAPGNWRDVRIDARLKRRRIAETLLYSQLLPEAVIEPYIRSVTDLKNSHTCREIWNEIDSTVIALSKRTFEEVIRFMRSMVA